MTDKQKSMLITALLAAGLVLVVDFYLKPGLSRKAGVRIK